VTEQAEMPFAISNNAVSQGVVNGNSFVYSFGGIDSTKIYSGNTLNSFRYDVTNNVWDTILPLPDTLGKIAAGASTIDSIIYIIGGYHVFSNGSEVSSNKVHRYNINTGTYLTDGTNIPVPIDDHVQAVWRDSLIYIITGWSNTGNVPDVQIYDTKNDSWQVGTSTPNSSMYKSFGSSGTIYNDTIFYFGGASTGFNFPAQTNFRKGAIDPNNPTQIAWSQSVPNFQIKGYRMACTKSDVGIHWLGGSQVTYNYNGIAYNGSGGVVPLNRNLMYNRFTGVLDTVPVSGASLPMDLRGISEFNNNIRYIVGGMEVNQKVSKKTLKLEYVSSSIKENKEIYNVVLYPNPAHNILTINSSVFFTKIKIYSLDGGLISENKYTVSGNELNISKLNKGMYMLALQKEGQIIHKQFVKF
jgi:hypothetical protein